jgi:hypothetical protein
MMRRGILTLARVSPPSRRSEFVMAFLEIAVGGFANSRRSCSGGATAACGRHVENKPAHAQPEESQ